jgi:hypothetical protein
MTSWYCRVMERRGIDYVIRMGIGEIDGT